MDFKNLTIKRILKGLLINGLAFIFLASCATVETGTKQTPVKTKLSVRMDSPISYSKPLPTYTPIWLDWEYSDKSVTSQLGFRGWDFTDDGRFDMVEILKEDGRPQAYAFDFDGDGKIDVIKQRADLIDSNL